MIHEEKSSGHAGIVEILLKRGANINAQNIDLKTALHLCIENGKRAFRIMSKTTN